MSTGNAFAVMWCNADHAEKQRRSAIMAPAYVAQSLADCATVERWADDGAPLAGLPKLGDCDCRALLVRLRMPGGALAWAHACHVGLDGEVEQCTALATVERTHADFPDCQFYLCTEHAADGAAWERLTGSL